MRRPWRKQPPKTLTRFELLSLSLSGLALFVSLIAAVVSPMVAYYYFDTQSRDYRERGRITVWHQALSHSGLLEESPQFDFETVAFIHNTGLRPIRELRFHVPKLSEFLATSELVVEELAFPPSSGQEGLSAIYFERSTKLVEQTRTHDVFALTTSFAPSRYLQVRLRQKWSKSASSDLWLPFQMTTEHDDPPIHLLYPERPTLLRGQALVEYLSRRGTLHPSFPVPGGK